MEREPVLTVGSIVALVTAVLVCLAAFGLPLSDEQTQAVIGLVAVVAPIVAALLSRPKVTPVADPKNDAGVPLAPVSTF